MKTACLLAGAAALLTGCATGPVLVTSDVQSFSSLATLSIPATYRFEHLPSQQLGQGSGQQLLEQLAEPALAKVGLLRDETKAQYNVQVSATLKSVTFGSDFYAYPYWGYPRMSMYYGYGGWWPGYGYGPGWGMGANWVYMDSYPRDVQREVSVVLRDAASGSVVYETRASNYGLYGGDGTVLPLMFEAALSGFPQPPQGIRRVTVTPPQAVQPAATPAPRPAAAASSPAS
ncbi:DUF4136 domain-containing protein [Variovorax sp. HJSM1_2]|uniref:DUF4136 domain-containing protein n=1 Tax=Variovorax sp. HJSM1_2 TaxID=3366263 RepID=UPI003BC27D24